MTYNEQLASRVRELLADRTDVTQRLMFGGLTFMVNGHMCCGVNKDELILRLDPDTEQAALRTPHARPMDFTRRRMSGFVTIAPAGTTGRRLARWVAHAVAHAEARPAKPQSRRGAAFRNGLAVPVRHR
jgi:TfoX/Sxy family transcriptional regulator of competence genes